MNHRQFACAVFLCVSMPALPFRAQAQPPIPLQNLPSGIKTNTQPLEVEVVEVSRVSAAPEAITRPAGKFILLVVNRTGNAKESFVLEPASVGEGTVGANPLIHLFDQTTPSLRHRLAGVVDLPQGSFDLKSVSSGKVLCKFQIN